MLICIFRLFSHFFFFFNDTATTEIYTLSLHDALPISPPRITCWAKRWCRRAVPRRDRKSTRLNSSHGYISYAVFCLKKKKQTIRKISFPGKEKQADHRKQEHCKV